MPSLGSFILDLKSDTEFRPKTKSLISLDASRLFNTLLISSFIPILCRNPFMCSIILLVPGVESIGIFFTSKGPLPFSKTEEVFFRSLIFA
jgi:hypothetical protein